MKRSNSRRHRASALALAAGTAVLALGRHASAQVTRTWNLATNGNWSVAGNWSPSGVPTAGDTANIVNALSTSLTVTYDYAGPAITLNALTIDDTGTGTNTLSMAANTLTLSGNEIVGSAGHATPLITRAGSAYTGASGSDWNTPTNWSPISVPGAGDSPVASSRIPPANSPSRLMATTPHSPRSAISTSTATPPSASP
jgi:hypothetical protein